MALSACAFCAVMVSMAFDLNFVAWVSRLILFFLFLFKLSFLRVADCDVMSVCVFDVCV